jgi:putative transposase
VNLAQRAGRLLVDHIDIVCNAVGYVKRRHPFHIDAFVVLPDHLHALWMLPPGDHDYATRWMLIKTNFSPRRVRGECVRRSRMGKGERGIWHRRYWEPLIRHDTDFARHVDYIHYNPVKQG